MRGRDHSVRLLRTGSEGPHETPVLRLRQLSQPMPRFASIKKGAVLSHTLPQSQKGPTHPHISESR